MAGVVGTVGQFRANSIFDPDATGVGHQPYGRDTLAEVWQSYKVFRIDAEIEFSQPDAAGIFGMVALQTVGDPYAFAGISIQSAMEKPNTWCQRVPNDGTSIKCTFSRSLHELCGVSWAQYKNDGTSFGSLMSASPGSVPMITVGTCNDTAATGTGVRVMVKLVYHTYLYGRITQVFS